MFSPRPVGSDEVYLMVKRFWSLKEMAAGGGAELDHDVKVLFLISGAGLKSSNMMFHCDTGDSNQKS